MSDSRINNPYEQLDAQVGQEGGGGREKKRRPTHQIIHPAPDLATSQNSRHFCAMAVAAVVQSRALFRGRSLTTSRAVSDRPQRPHA